MDSMTEAGAPSGIYFGMSGSEIKAGRDIGCGNVTGQNVNNIVNNYHGSLFGFGGSSEDLLMAKIISWLTTFSVDYFPTYEEARSQRAPDTGKWFFDTTTYRTWVTTWGTKYRNLECVGIPGAGKTTMASTVIEDLQAKFLVKWGYEIVLYAYFRHDTQSTQSIPNVLASLLLQIIKHKRKVSTDVRNLYEDYSMRKDMAPATDRMISLLRSELSAFFKVYIVVDALDEYSVPDYLFSHALVKQLQLLNARLLITSRHPVGFTPDTFLTLHVSAHADDVRIFVQQHLTGHLATILTRTPGLLDEIVSAVVAKSDGMFIVAKLLVDCIPTSQSLTANELRAAVKRLPTGIEDTYEMSMTRIQHQEPRLTELGLQALCWVYFSKRRLTVSELQHALSFQRYKVISQDDLIGEDRIMTACAGLISFVARKAKDSSRRQRTMECQFSHFTTREFLDRTWRKYFPYGKRQITETCLEYLSVVASDVPPEITEAAQLDYWHNAVWQQYCRDEKLALCPYAVEYWFHHARDIDEKFDLDIGTNFFDHPVSPYAAFPNDTSIFPSIKMTPEDYWMLCFARFGLLKDLEKHLEERLADSGFAIRCGNGSAWQTSSDIHDEHGQTALDFASSYGHSKVVEFLLDEGADIGNRIGNWSTLHFAAQAGDSGIDTVQLLIDRGAWVDQPDWWKRAPISYAIEPEDHLHRKPSLDIIRLLLQHGVDLYRVDHKYDTPLSLAQRSEYPEIRRLLEHHARSHPLQPRTYEQRFPEGYFNSRRTRTNRVPPQLVSAVSSSFTRS